MAATRAPRRAGHRAHRPARTSRPASAGRRAGRRAVRAPRRHAHGRLRRPCPDVRCVAGRAVRDAGLPVRTRRHPSRSAGPGGHPTAGVRGPGGVAGAPTDGAPDFGPRRAASDGRAPRVVGARPFLIAWNIQLESGDLGIARRIAASIRERDGGLPAVQALGIPLASMGCVQVSMNLLDHERTPMWRVFERVRDLAARAAARPSAIRSSSGSRRCERSWTRPTTLACPRPLPVDARVLAAARLAGHP